MQEKVNHDTADHVVMSQVAMKSLDILRKADFSERQSRAQVRSMLVMFDAGIRHIDQGLGKLKKELKSEMKGLRSEMDLRFKAAEKIAEIRYEALRSDSRRSTMVMIIGFAGLILTIVLGL